MINLVQYENLFKNLVKFIIIPKPVLIFSYNLIIKFSAFKPKFQLNYIFIYLKIRDCKKLKSLIKSLIFVNIGCKNIMVGNSDIKFNKAK